MPLMHTFCMFSLRPAPGYSAIRFSVDFRGCCPADQLMNPPWLPGMKLVVVSASESGSTCADEPLVGLAISVEDADTLCERESLAFATWKSSLWSIHAALLPRTTESCQPHPSPPLDRLMHGICLQQAVYRISQVADELMSLSACLQCWTMEQASVFPDQKKLQEDVDRERNPHAHPQCR